MRNKHLKNILLGVLAVGCTGCYTWTQDEQLEQTSMKPIDQKISEKLIASNKKQLVRSESDPAATEHELLKMIADIPKAKAMYEVGKISNMAIKFYGRVIDQHDSPVAGAKVGVGLLRWRILDAGGEHHEFTTDPEGYFVIDGISGNVFTIRNIEKEGYEPQGIKTFSAANQPKTSRENPFIFHAWKKTEAEHLIQDKLEVGYRPDGQFYQVPLNSIKEQLKISIQTDPSGDRSNPLDWSMKLKVINGGLIESNDGFMLEAPSEGYSPSLSYAYKKGDAEFSNDIQKKFYLKARGGEIYGRLECRIHPYYGNDNIVAVDITYWLNPNGSRNLQYDPSKRIPLKK